MEEREIRENRSRFFRLLFSGALGIAVLAVIECLQLRPDAFDAPLTVSLYCFAISVPLTATGIVLPTMGDKPVLQKLDAFIFYIGGRVGLSVSFLGMVCLFWHFFTAAGIIFAVFGLLAYMFSVRYSRRTWATPASSRSSRS